MPAQEPPVEALSVPPQSPLWRRSKRRKSVRNASAAWTSAALATWIALITLTPVRRATSPQNDGPSSPFSCTIVSPSSSTALSTSSSSGSRRPRRPRTCAGRPPRSPPRRRARTKRGARVEWISPSAHAPRRTASAASSRLVSPQNLTRIGPAYGDSPRPKALSDGTPWEWPDSPPSFLPTWWAGTSGLRRIAATRGGPYAERHREGLFAAPSRLTSLRFFPRASTRGRLDDLFHPRDLPAVYFDDDVAAQPHLGAPDRRLGVAAVDPGLIGGAAFDDHWTITLPLTGSLRAFTSSGVTVPPLIPR